MITEKRFDVVALGELLIDFTESGLSGQGNTLFEANPGGAPCNVLAMLKKLGRDCLFVGKVGADMFGDLLSSIIREAGICAGGLVRDPDVRTTLAFVKKLPDGDRDFSLSQSRCRHDADGRGDPGALCGAMPDISFRYAVHDA